MKWVKVSKSSQNEIYHLYKDDKKVLTLVYNPFSNSTRVECENEKRVFLIRKEGFRRNKIVIRSEYGIKIGELGQENRENYIDVNDERFYYDFHNNPLAEIALYRDSKNTPFVTCSLTTSGGKPGINFTQENSISPDCHPGLLMALCWYMFLPVAFENVVEYAW